MSYSGCHVLLEFRQNRYFQCSQTCYKPSWGADIPLFNRFNNSLKVDKNGERTVGDGHNANTHVRKMKPGLKLEAEWRHGAATRRRRKTPESTGSNLQQDVSTGQPRGAHAHAHRDQHTTGGVRARAAAVPASGSSLMHVDRTLEPLGAEPSGSVCPVRQPAFTEVPGTSPVPACRDWLFKWTHQFISLLPNHQTGDRLIHSWSFWTQRTCLHI